ncbi:MAG: hypothetical protein PHT02_00755 [Tissierellia bacterium]|nr:hypothetical protein [Tissierellia bacterium]
MEELVTRFISVIKDFKEYECNFKCDKCPLNKHFGDNFNNNDATFCDILNDLNDYMEIG